MATTNKVYDQEDFTCNVMGEVWSVYFRNEEDDEALNDNEGYCDDCGKFIVIRKIAEKKNPLDLGEAEQRVNQKRTIRHELVHAFLSESGLSASSLALEEGWATNEEMVDWIARQSPKMFALFSELEIL